MQTGLCLSPQQAAEIFAAVPGVAKEGVQLGGRGAAEITIVTGQKSIASNFIGRLCVTFKVWEGVCSEISDWSVSLPNNLFFPCTNRASEKRNKRQDVLAVGFNSRLVTVNST